MKVYAQKQSQPQQKTAFHPSPLAQHKILNQAVSVSSHADAEGHKVVTSAFATARFAHDFSRMPAHSKALVRLEAKLAVNTPGDIYEQEADRVSEQVMHMPEPRLQRACASDGGCSKWQTEQPMQERKCLQTTRIQASNSEQTTVKPIVNEALSSPAQYLDTATRSFMEPRFGHDFRWESQSASYGSACGATRNAFQS